MRLRVDAEELCGVDVSISLRRAEARVAEQLLDRAKIRATLQQMRRKRVAQRMRAHARPHAARGGMPAHETIDAADCETSAAIVHEERLRRAPGASVPRLARAHERLAILEV